MLSSIIETVFTLNFLNTTISLATPIVFAACGAFIANIAGVSNIAIESIMTFGAISSIIGSYLFQNAVAGLAFGLLIGVLTALLIAFFSMKLGADIMFVGIALNTIADSLAIFVLYLMTGQKGTSASLPAPTLGKINIPIIKDIPVISTIFSGKHILTYVCWICVIILFILIYKTPLGMRIRSCGLNPKAAETAGINVPKLRLFALILSGLLAAFGGIFLSLNYLLIFSKSMVAGQGWMGVAANGVAQGNFGVLLIVALIFAVCRAMAACFSTNAAFPTDLVSSVPYFFVLVFVTVVSVVNYYKIKAGKVDESR